MKSTMQNYIIVIYNSIANESHQYSYEAMHEQLHEHPWNNLRIQIYFLVFIATAYCFSTMITYTSYTVHQTQPACSPGVSKYHVRKILPFCLGRQSGKDNVGQISPKPMIESDFKHNYIIQEIFF